MICYAAQGILRTTGSHLGRSWSGFASWKIQSSYMEWTNVADGKYKWVHYNCERLSEKDIDWMKQLPEKAYFEADGWSYGIAHQYDNGYGTVESRYAFDQYWNASYGAECDGKRRLIFGHTHRQCIHTLGEGMEWNG